MKRVLFVAVLVVVVVGAWAQPWGGTFDFRHEDYIERFQWKTPAEPFPEWYNASLNEGRYEILVDTDPKQFGPYGVLRYKCNAYAELGVFKPS